MPIWVPFLVSHHYFTILRACTFARAGYIWLKLLLNMKDAGGKCKRRFLESQPHPATLVLCFVDTARLSGKQMPVLVKGDIFTVIGLNNPYVCKRIQCYCLKYFSAFPDGYHWLSSELQILCKHLENPNLKLAQRQLRNCHWKNLVLKISAWKLQWPLYLLKS